jgi:NADPH-dependent 2,4-dienoyl-CoA reductase/sulfur reductase-like enzyme
LSVRRIVIVGGGLAGHRAACALVDADFDGEVTIVGDEVHRPYDRPPLSKQVLGGIHEEDSAFYDSDVLAHANWKLGAPAAALDVGRSVVTLADGEEVTYDGLIIATGRRAMELPGFHGHDGVHMLRSLDDSRALREAAVKDKRVVIVGAGFIGCEVAATLRGVGVDDVTMVEMAPHPMPVVGPDVGARAAKIHQDHGVRLHLATVVTEPVGNGRIEGVRLENGEVIPADLVLISIGSVPNSEWLEGSGLELNRGTVVCDEHCFAVGAENIVAAGDVASWPHPDAGGEPVWVEHWTNARDMGAIAAKNLIAASGEREPHTSVPTFWSDQYDVKIKSAGFLQAADRIEVIEEDPEKPSLVAEAHKGDLLTGAIVFNKNRRIIDYQRQLAVQTAATNTAAG